MNLKKIIENLSKINDNKENYIIYDVISDLNLPFEYFDEDKALLRFECYYYQSWLCTGIRVGKTAIFLDNEFVATTIQLSRSSPTDIQYLNIEAATKLHSFLSSCYKVNLDHVDIIDLDSIISDYYQLEFSNQIISQPFIMLNDELVQCNVIQKFYGSEKFSTDELYDLKINFPNLKSYYIGEFIRLDIGIVPMTRLYFKYNIKELT